MPAFYLEHFGVPTTVACVAASCLLVLSACASQQVLNEQLAASRAALEQSRLAGAPSAAPEDYTNAREKLARATAAAGAQDNVVAMRLAEQALVDAERAQVKAQATRTAAAATEILAGNQALRDELNRPANPPGVKP